jgi:hypothetical protein
MLVSFTKQLRQAPAEMPVVRMFARHSEACESLPKIGPHSLSLLAQLYRAYGPAQKKSGSYTALLLHNFFFD